MLTFKKLETAEAYKQMVSEFSFYVDAQLRIFENSAEKNDYSFFSSMPALISLVNSIGYLRGQDGMFLEIRPQDSEMQRDLYKNEDHFEMRLQKIIDGIRASEFFEQYQERLQEYFIKSRS